MGFKGSQEAEMGTESIPDLEDGRRKCLGWEMEGLSGTARAGVAGSEVMWGEEVRGWGWERCVPVCLNVLSPRNAEMNISPGPALQGKAGGKAQVSVTPGRG